MTRRMSRQLNFYPNIKISKWHHKIPRLRMSGNFYVHRNILTAHKRSRIMKLLDTIISAVIASREYSNKKRVAEWTLL